MHIRIPVAIFVSLIAFLATASTAADPNRELKVHLAQANNDSPYTFVRAKFEPGEVTDPWALRFFDDKGTDVPYFVWDSVTWKVAHHGRDDWGSRFALINHAPGDAPEVRNARGEKLKWARKSLPILAAKLDAEDQAAENNPDSLCAAIYLLQHRAPAFGKERLTLRIFPTSQTKPEHQQFQGEKVEKRIALQQGDFALNNLPDRMAVAWKGKELFQYAGFTAGSVTGTSSHADATKPYTIEIWKGIITKVNVTGQTNGRKGAPMNWQCTYWLFPEGGYVALEGFSLDDADGYKGGPQKLSTWQASADFVESQKPTWDAPWWVHKAGQGFVATHLLYAPSLACGYANNPYTINTERHKKEPHIEQTGKELTLSWSYEMNDSEIARVLSPEPIPRPNLGLDALKPAPVDWKSKVDWLYRQYLVGVGNKPQESETALRNILGAAAGWIDRPIDEERTAATLVEIIKKLPVERSGTEYEQLIIATMMLNGDKAAASNYMSRARNQSEKADSYIAAIRANVSNGGKAAGGSHLEPTGVRVEGWTGNPCYFAHLLPAYLRVFDFFELPYPREQYHLALARFAEFTLDVLGGKPFDLQKWNKVGSPGTELEFAL